GTGTAVGWRMPSTSSHQPSLQLNEPVVDDDHGGGFGHSAPQTGGSVYPGPQAAIPAGVMDQSPKGLPGMTTQTSPEAAGAWKNTRIAGRIAELDGLRGLAILLVLFYHYVASIGAPRYPLWAFVTTSIQLFWSGVDLFFVLSGFLISGTLMDSVESPRYFKTFYLRRSYRIFPLYFSWLALFYVGIYANLDKALGSHIFQ